MEGTLRLAIILILTCIIFTWVMTDDVEEVEVYYDTTRSVESTVTPQKLPVTNEVTWPDEETDIPETTVEETTAASETAEDTTVVIDTEPETDAPYIRKYFDVPLSESLQDTIFDICSEHGIDPALVVAVIWKESSYRPHVVGDSGDSFGLMQINAKWHQARMKKVGCTDLLDPCQNVAVGIDFLAELFRDGNSVEWTLMAYNGGRSYADRYAAKGVVSDYAKAVLAKAEVLRASCE